MVKLWLFRLASFLCPLVPRQLGCLVASLIGSLAFYLAPDARSVVQDNIEVVLGSGAPAARIRSMARQVFCNAAKNYFELFWLRRLDLEKFGGMVRVDGSENLRRALDWGRGVVVVTAHLGNFDICGQEIAAKSFDMTVLVEPLQPRQMFDLVVGLRGSKGVRYVPVGSSALKEAVRTLRRGGAVVMACDRDVQKTGRQTMFFGELARLPQGAAHIALRTGATVVPAFSERLPDENFVVHIDPPVEIHGTGDLDADTRVAMARIVGAMEKRIGARPDQWAVFERVWPDRQKPEETEAEK